MHVVRHHFWTPEWQWTIFCQDMSWQLPSCKYSLEQRSTSLPVSVFSTALLDTTVYKKKWRTMKLLVQFKKKKNSPALRRLVITGWAVCVRAEMCRVCSPGLPRWHGPFAGPTQPSPYMRWPGVSGLCSLVPAFPLLRIRYSFWGNILLTCGENSVKIPATEFQSEYYSSSMQGQKSSLVLQTVTKLHNKLLSCVCQEMLDALSHQTNL